METLQTVAEHRARRAGARQVADWLERLGAQRDHVEAWKNNLGDVARRLEALEARALQDTVERASEARVNVLSRRLEEMEKEVQAFSSERDALMRRLADVGRFVDARVKESLDAQQEEAERRIADAMAGFGMRMEQITVEFPSLVQALMSDGDALAESLVDVEERLLQMHRQLAAGADALQARLSETEDTLRQRIDAAEARLDRMEDGQAALSERIESGLASAEKLQAALIEQVQDRMGRDQEALEQRVGASLGEVRATVDQLVEAQAETSRRMLEIPRRDVEIDCALQRVEEIAEGCERTRLDLDHLHGRVLQLERARALPEQPPAAEAVPYQLLDERIQQEAARLRGTLEHVREERARDLAAVEVRIQERTAEELEKLRVDAARDARAAFEEAVARLDSSMAGRIEKAMAHLEAATPRRIEDAIAKLEQAMGRRIHECEARLDEATRRIQDSEARLREQTTRDVEKRVREVSSEVMREKLESAVQCVRTEVAEGLKDAVQEAENRMRIAAARVVSDTAATSRSLGPKAPPFVRERDESPGVPIHFEAACIGFALVLAILFFLAFVFELSIPV